MSRRIESAQLIQKLQHVFAAAVLLGDGVSRIGHANAGWVQALAVAEVLSASFVLGSFARAARRLKRAPPIQARHESHHAVDWFDIWMAGMLVIEAVVHHHETNHWPRPTLLAVEAEGRAQR